MSLMSPIFVILLEVNVVLEVDESQSLWVKSVGLWFNPWPLYTAFRSLLSKIMMMMVVMMSAIVAV